MFPFLTALFPGLATGAAMAAPAAGAGLAALKGGALAAPALAGGAAATGIGALAAPAAMSATTGLAGGAAGGAAGGGIAGLLGGSNLPLLMAGSTLASNLLQPTGTGKSRSQPIDGERSAPAPAGAARSAPLGSSSRETDYGFGSNYAHLPSGRPNQGGISGLLRRAEGGPVMAGGGQAGGMNDKQIIAGAVAALQGQGPSPERQLAMFVQRFGEQALRDLVSQVQSGRMQGAPEGSPQGDGMMRGPGDGMSDMIPARVPNGPDVVMSDGEFVVPSDVVSGIGNGSSDAGAQRLGEMMNRVRSERTGTPRQPRPIDPERMMPV